jgi:hypothetical protein
VSAEPWDPEIRSGWSGFVVALHLRHPDAVPELKVAAKGAWEGSAPNSQKQYELTRRPGDPETFDEWIATRDPFTAGKVAVNLIVATFDNGILGQHINNTIWAIVDVSSARNRLLLSNRPVIFSNLGLKHGYAALPIGPDKFFVAVNDRATLGVFGRNGIDESSAPRTSRSRGGRAGSFGPATARRTGSSRIEFRKQWSRCLCFPGSDGRPNLQPNRVGAGP